MNNSTHKTPSLGYALITFGICFLLIIVAAVFLKAKMQPMFLLACLIAFYMCHHLGYTFRELQQGMMKYMSRGLIPILIALCVGAFVAILCASGTIAYVTKICLKIINPSYFMFMAFLICVLFSGFTGTSYGTTGTIGVALMGVGLSMGINPLLVASPIISGAMFGDAFSPVSDTPNIASASTGLDLFKLITYQVTTLTAPSMIICAIIYFFWGKSVGGGEMNEDYVNAVLASIDSSFNLSPVLFLPLIVVMVLLLLKVPVAPSILSGTGLAYILAMIYQGYSFKEVSYFMWNGFTLESDNSFMVTLFNRGGMTSMNGNIFMVLSAFALFGILSTAGITDAIFSQLDRFATNRRSATLTSMGLGLAVGFASGSPSLSSVSVGNFMAPSFQRNRQNMWDLGRLTTVACLFFVYLVPWAGDPNTTCGFLGVEPIEMIPYFIFIPVTTVVLLINTFTGIDKKFSPYARGEVAAFDNTEEIK